MDVIVYDDDLAFTEFMRNTLNELSEKHNGVFNAPIFFSNMNEIMAHIDASENSSLYLLDIMTGEEQTGFEIGNHIKNMNDDNLIIYVTDFKDEILVNMKQKLKSIGFILKDSKHFLEELEESVLTAHDLLLGKCFVHKSSRKVINVRYSDIYYFEKKKNTAYAYIIHANGRTSVRSSLHELKSKLPAWFCYASKEFIVNTRTIVHLDNTNKTVHFNNEVSCPFSRLHKQALFKWTSE